MEFFKANVNLGEVFVQLAAFVIVFWTLKALAWKRILQALENRRSRIQEEFDKIEAAKKELEALRTRYEHALSHIEDETRQKLQQAVSDGKRIAHEIQEEARKNAREILEKTNEDVQLEIAKARLVLRDEIADLVVSATEQLLEKEIDSKKDRQIVLDFIQNLEKTK